jgi:iron(III) transport system substrate-binding protein
MKPSSTKTCCLSAIRPLVRLALVSLAALVVLGCAERVPPRVVVYVTADRDVALPVFADFTKATGIRVKAKYRDEFGGGDAGNAEQMVHSLEMDHAAPKCDLFWDNELLGTLQLERAGVLRSHTSAATNALPAVVNGVAGRSPQNMWYTIGTDARVLVVNTHQVAEARRPESIEDLTDPQWYERVGIAKPLTGPPATQAACLFAAWGEAKATEFYRGVKRNARIFATDREVARAVANGTLAFGLTGARDALAEQAAGAPIVVIYPDQGEGAIGTLYVPSTVALVHNSPHPEAAAKLLDFLISAEVRQRLAKAEGSGNAGEEGVRAMPVDLQAVAESWDSAAEFLRAEFAAQ